jgi:hypothetical protein
MQDDQSGALAVENGPNGESYTVIVKSKKTGQVIELHSGEKVEWDAGGGYGEIGGGTIEGCE